jgi:hypothetical protein
MSDTTSPASEVIGKPTPWREIQVPHGDPIAVRTWPAGLMREQIDAERVDSWLWRFPPGTSDETIIAAFAFADHAFEAGQRAGRANKAHEIRRALAEGTEDA